MSERLEKASDRLDKAAVLLQAIPRRYAEQFGNVLDLPGTSLRPGGRSGKPTSKAPPGVDVQLRGALTEVARAVVVGHWHLRHWKLPTKGWAPTTLGRFWTEPVVRVRCEACGVEGRERPEHRKAKGDTPACPDPSREVIRAGFRVSWSPEDPWDLAVRLPLPELFVGACQHLAARQAGAFVGWETASQRRRIEWGRSVGAVNLAVRVLERVGAWEDPSPPGARCKGCTFRIPRKGHKLCDACIKETQRARAKGRAA